MSNMYWWLVTMELVIMTVITTMVVTRAFPDFTEGG
jgi:hypothetical protein